jgi:hypothetical protein
MRRASAASGHDGRNGMSDENYPDAEEVTNRIFGITMAGVLAFIIVVFAFIIL